MSIESDKSVDTVIELRNGDVVLNPGDKVDVNTLITIVVSKGPAGESGASKVTKSHTIKLPDGLTETYKLEIYSSGSSTPVYSADIQPDAQSELVVTLTGSGIQYFDIYINGAYSWPERVDFTSK